MRLAIWYIVLSFTPRGIGKERPTFKVRQGYLMRLSVKCCVNLASTMTQTV